MTFWWQSILTQCNLIGGGLHQVTFGWLERSLNEKKNDWLLSRSEVYYLLLRGWIYLETSTLRTDGFLLILDDIKEQSGSSSHGEYEDF